MASNVSSKNNFNRRRSIDVFNREDFFSKTRRYSLGKTPPKSATKRKAKESISKQPSKVGKKDDQSKSSTEESRVAGWSSDFERLLSDPVGLRTFTEFLKKEFSHENIYFWTACERYRQLTSLAERRLAANQIIARHLSAGASDPVNVDSFACQSAHDGLDAAEPNLFENAQRQIYNLMKFDSFSRFLKSDLYKESLEADTSGRPLPLDTNQSETVKSGIFGGTKKKGPEKEPGPRRRSLLPSNWPNFRSSSKSRDRAAAIQENAEERRSVSSQDGPSLDSSADSFGNNEESKDCNLARVILPDKATTVVQTNGGETIRALVARLLDKRGLKFTSFDVFATTGNNTEKPLDLGEDCQILGCTEVRVESRVLFRLELPSKKSIGVKAKPAKIVRDVLGPILNQYGWKLDKVEVLRDGKLPVDFDSTVSSIDNCRLIVVAATPSSDELNRIIFDEVMRNKRMTVRSEEDQVSLRTNSSVSSSLDLPPQQQAFVTRRQGGLNYSATDHNDRVRMPPPFPPDSNPSRRLPYMNEVGIKPVSDELYEGLKVAQRGRLEDQRGTEINFEMPDFLKRSQFQDKENHYPPMPPSSVPIPQPPRSQDRLSHGGRRDAFPPTSCDQHEFDYALLGSGSGSHPHFNESNYQAISEAGSTFMHDPEYLFDTNTSRFNDSRISFGNMPQPPGVSGQPDNIYETLTKYSSGSHLPQQFGWKEPPPLPPKPRLSYSVPSMHSSSRLSAVSSGSYRPSEASDGGEHGYSVSFV